MARQIGKVKWFNDEKGFGFITPEDGKSPECFVHHTGIRRVAPGRRNLLEGSRVEYETEPGTGEKGPRAVDVVVLAP